MYVNIRDFMLRIDVTFQPPREQCFGLFFFLILAVAVSDCSASVVIVFPTQVILSLAFSHVGVLLPLGAPLTRPGTFCLPGVCPSCYEGCIRREPFSCHHSWLCLETLLRYSDSVC